MNKNQNKIYSVKSNQDSCLLQLVASYDTQEDTLGLFYFPGPTGGHSRCKQKCKSFAAYITEIHFVTVITELFSNNQKAHLSPYLSLHMMQWTH